MIFGGSMNENVKYGLYHFGEDSIHFQEVNKNGKMVCILNPSQYKKYKKYFEKDGYKVLKSQPMPSIKWEFK
jgi:hypothetical protein